MLLLDDHSPAPRHRRWLLLQWIDRLDFASVLDAGCAQPFLLRQILDRSEVEGFGCDLSDRMIDANRTMLPGCQFRTLDLRAYPGCRRMFSIRLPEKGACTPENAGLFTAKTDSYTEHPPTSRIGSDRRDLAERASLRPGDLLRGAGAPGRLARRGGQPGPDDAQAPPARSR